MVAHGVVLPTRGTVLESQDAPELVERTRTDVIDLASRAEAVGFDAVWVGDSVTAKPRHEPLTTLAAVAEATDSVGLGTAVYLPALRDAVHVAHATATVDLIAGGRFAFGIGSGSVPAEYTAIGRPWSDRGRALDETLDVVTDLWSGASVTYAGEHVQCDDAGLGFSLPEPPPIYVGSAVHPEKGVRRPIRERVADHGAGWFPVQASPEAVARGRRQLEAGDRAADLEVLLYHDVVIDDDPDVAKAKARRFIEAYYSGYEPSAAALERRGVFGPPEAVREHLDRYTAAGVDQFVTRFCASDQVGQLDRFADAVG